jgi:hypothetical protein
MTDAEKTDLKKEILLEEYEAEQQLGLCIANLRGAEEDFKILTDKLSLLIMHLNATSMDPRNIAGSRTVLTAISPTLRRHGLSKIEESCNESLAAQERTLRVQRRKREAKMCAEPPLL